LVTVAVSVAVLVPSIVVAEAVKVTVGAVTVPPHEERNTARTGRVARRDIRLQSIYSSNRREACSRADKHGEVQFAVVVLPTDPESRV
jgi:hypothetical protein